MSTSVAIRPSGSNETATQVFQDLSMFNARADLMGLGWPPVAGLLEYEPTPIEAELVGMVIEDPCGRLASLTRDNPVRQRVPDKNRKNFTFQSFVRDIFVPYLLKEVSKLYHEAQGQLENFVEDKQLMFQDEPFKSANEWMRDHQKAFRQQAMSVQMLKERLAALEQARRDNYDIHLEIDVVMRAAPPLPLVQAPPVHYAAELAKYMVDERYQSCLTELASQNMRQQMQLEAQQQQFKEQQQQLALTASRLSPFETAVAKALS